MGGGEGLEEDWFEVVSHGAGIVYRQMGRVLVLIFFLRNSVDKSKNICTFVNQT